MIKVLVVEDNPVNMELVIEMITAVGFTPETAKNGEEGVKKAEIETYDLIIMDIQLPGMDGVAAARIIKSRPGYENVPCIALTAFAMKGDRERFLAAGFNEYVQKPVDVARFMKLLERYRK